VGAGGAIALEILMNKANPHLPATFQTGWMNTGVKLAAALGIGYGASRLIGKEKGQLVMLGGLVVVLANALRGVISQNFPNAGLSAYMNDYTAYPIGVGYVDPAPRLGAYMPAGGNMSAYMNRGGADTIGNYDGGDGM
jgi:hypothetical protein